MGEFERIFFPLFIAVILSFIIVHCLVTVFEITVDTIFLCYCEDVQANDGSALKPYYMSSGLQNVMEELKEYGQKTKGAGATKDDEASIILNEAPAATV
jgi:Plasma-membrane choline transporter